MEKLVKTKNGIISTSIIMIVIMFITDYYIRPEYQIKSLVKIVVFLVIPIIYTKNNWYLNWKEFFQLGSKGQLVISFILGIVVYGIIIGGFLLLKDFIDLENIKGLLSKNLNVNKGNFVFIAIYISFFNSLLEEFFFRGFLFLGLKKLGKTTSAYVISSLLFAIYHIAIMANWFNIYIYILAIVGLFVGGLIFNGLNDTRENIYNSWLVHMFANLAINTVGFIMYGII